MTIANCKLQILVPKISLFAQVFIQLRVLFHPRRCSYRAQRQPHGRVKMLKMKRQLSLPAPCWNRCSNYTKHCCSRSMRTWVRGTRVSIKGRFGRGYQIGDRRATHFFPAESMASPLLAQCTLPDLSECVEEGFVRPEGTTLNKKSCKSFFLIQCVYPEPDVLLLITICLIIVLALCRILVLPVMGGVG